MDPYVPLEDLFPLPVFPAEMVAFMRDCFAYAPESRSTCDELLHHAYFHLDGFASRFDVEFERMLQMDEAAFQEELRAAAAAVAEAQLLHEGMLEAQLLHEGMLEAQQLHEGTLEAQLLHEGMQQLHEGMLEAQQLHEGTLEAQQLHEGTQQLHEGMAAGGEADDDTAAMAKRQKKKKKKPPAAEKPTGGMAVVHSEGRLHAAADAGGDARGAGALQPPLGKRSPHAAAPMWGLDATSDAIAAAAGGEVPMADGASHRQLPRRRSPQGELPTGAVAMVVSSEEAAAHIGHVSKLAARGEPSIQRSSKPPSRASRGVAPAGIPLPKSTLGHPPQLRRYGLTAGSDGEAVRSSRDGGGTDAALLATAPVGGRPHAHFGQLPPRAGAVRAHGRRPDLSPKLRQLPSLGNTSRAPALLGVPTGGGGKASPRDPLQPPVRIKLAPLRSRSPSRRADRGRGGGMGGVRPVFLRPSVSIAGLKAAYGMPSWEAMRVGTPRPLSRGRLQSLRVGISTPVSHFLQTMPIAGL